MSGERAERAAEFPTDPDGLLRRSLAFSRDLQRVKSSTEVADYGWYPYGSLAVLPEIVGLIRDSYEEITDLFKAQTALDIGCGDGDLAMLLDHLGVTVDALDHAETNFNQMRGVHLLKRVLNAGTRITDLDLDSYFTLPAEQYGVAFFLGTLYHLKSPLYVLEEIAKRAAYCILSTRVARTTRKGGTNIESEPVAYLLNAREANNDPTNYWIFSPAGLYRLLERANWLPVRELRRGCAQGSNPVESDADERCFLLLKSRYRYTGLYARPLYGWHQTEEDSWRWTTKEFGVEVVLPKDIAAREFALKLVVPETVIEQGQITLRCQAAGESAGSITCDRPGAIEFRGRFPPSAQTGTTVCLAFQVESSFEPAGDGRELGILVPLLSRTHHATTRLPFRIS